MNVDWLIFSKDRACQLELLLRSLERFAPAIPARATVLWMASDEDYLVGYEQVAASNRAKARSLEIWAVSWWPQTQFEADIREWLRAVGPNVGFLVDDDVFFAPAALPEALPWTYRLPATHRWRGNPDPEQGYPLTVDGSVYAKATILPLLDFRFDSPTQLEAGLANQWQAFEPEVIHSGGQALVNTPWTRVSEHSGNGYMGHEAAELNARFLSGQRLDLDALVTLALQREREGTLAPHTELPLLWA